MSSSGSSQTRSVFAVVRDHSRRRAARSARCSRRSTTPSSPVARAARSSSDRVADALAPAPTDPLAPRDLSSRRSSAARRRARASSSRSIRFSRLRNSKRRNISRSCERSGGASTSCGGVEVEVEVAPHRRELLRLARDVGVLEDVLLARRRKLVGVLDHARRPSRTARSAGPAVLSPMPGTPGMLSDVSPFSPMKSGTWSGRMP